MPAESETTVKEMLAAVDKMFSYTRGANLKCLSPDGREIAPDSTVSAVIVVEGLKDLQHPRHSWEHPVGIIGGGFYGVKLGMEYMLHRNENIVIFDGHARAVAMHGTAQRRSTRDARRTSEPSTRGGVSSIATAGTRATVPNPSPEARSTALVHLRVARVQALGVDHHPVREQLLDAMRYCIEEYGFTRHCNFEMEVSTLKIVGDPEAEVTKLDKASIELAGGGHGVYGTTGADDGRMKDARASILSNGAFAVELVENAAAKVYIITRRKSLLCPRLPCWFCHQGPDPILACQLLNHGLPAQARQSSRFGIGDVTFLLWPSKSTVWTPLASPWRNAAPKTFHDRRRYRHGCLKRFTTFSAGPNACGFAKPWYYMHNHPGEFREAVAQGMMKLLPVHQKSDTHTAGPARVHDQRAVRDVGWRRVCKLFPKRGPRFWRRGVLQVLSTPHDAPGEQVLRVLQGRLGQAPEDVPGELQGLCGQERAVSLHFGPRQKLV